MKKPKVTSTTVVVRSAEELAEARKRVTGTESKSIANLLLTQMASMSVWGRDRTEAEKGAAAVDFLAAFHPASATEAMLSVQTFSVHEAALLFLQRATTPGQTFDGADANVLRAVRLMRLFNEQVELMAKLKGKTSQQKVTVEHVHVHQGGQAIVGAVAPTGPGVGDDTGNR